MIKEAAWRSKPGISWVISIMEESGLIEVTTPFIEATK
jgi:hypothetical protein